MAEKKIELINQTILLSTLYSILNKQACQIEIMKTKNEELTMLVGYLKEIIVDIDPIFRKHLDAIKL